MADWVKADGVAEASVVKMDGVAKAACVKRSGVTTPAGTQCWVVGGLNGRIMISENATGDSGSWVEYLAPDSGANALKVAFGKDHADNDRWIMIWDRANNMASVSTSSIPNEPAAWATLDLDAGDWTANKTPEDVAWSNGPNPPLWVIGGNGGCVAYSSSGSADQSDWQAEVTTATTFAGNRSILGVSFSGSSTAPAGTDGEGGAHVILAGAMNRIASGSVPTYAAPLAQEITWGDPDGDGTKDHAFNSDDYNVGVTWWKIHAAGEGANTRVVAVADSNAAANTPYFATGSKMFFGRDTGSGIGWKELTGTPDNSFGADTNATARKMKALTSDGEGNWMIVGREGTGYVSTDNCNTWTRMDFSGPVPGTEGACTQLLWFVAQATIGGTSTWMAGGEDGYLAVSTNNGASGSWVTKHNPWYAAGAGANEHLFTAAFSKPIPYPGST